MRALVRLAALHARRLIVPAPVVSQVWRDGSRQVALSRFLKMDLVEVPPLDEARARTVGALCGRAGTRDVVDAMVALTARRENAVVVSSDPEDLQALDPGLAIHRIEGPATCSPRPRRGSRHGARRGRSRGSWPGRRARPATAGTP
jgi:predicted nucleic acid-binding protein